MAQLWLRPFSAKPRQDARSLRKLGCGCGCAAQGCAVTTAPWCRSGKRGAAVAATVFGKAAAGCPVFAKVGLRMRMRRTGMCGHDGTLVPEWKTWRSCGCDRFRQSRGRMPGLCESWAADADAPHRDVRSRWHPGAGVENVAQLWLRPFSAKPWQDARSLRKLGCGCGCAAQGCAVTTAPWCRSGKRGAAMAATVFGKAAAGCPVFAKRNGASPSGKAPGFDPGIRRFESCRPSHPTLPARSIRASGSGTRPGRAVQRPVDDSSVV